MTILNVLNDRKVLKGIFIDNVPCRSYLFMLDPSSSFKKEANGLTKEVLTSFVRSVTMNKKKITIKFLCDEKNAIWSFFNKEVPFNLSWLTRTGNITNTMPIYYKKKDMYVEKMAHDAINDLLIGVVEIERI